MPPTLINITVGVLLAVALLGPAFTRRSVAVVALAAAVPDLDAAVSLLLPGATNAFLHTLFIPAIAAVGLWYETTRRERSVIRERFGWQGVRVAWVAIAAYLVAGIGLDLFSTESVALLYPLSDRYYAVVGQAIISTQEGFIQTYVSFGNGWVELASPGTTTTHHVDSWLNPAGDERRLRLIETGWQAVLVLTAIVALPAKALVERSDR